MRLFPHSRYPNQSWKSRIVNALPSFLFRPPFYRVKSITVKEACERKALGLSRMEGYMPWEGPLDSLVRPRGLTVYGAAVDIKTLTVVVFGEAEGKPGVIRYAVSLELAMESLPE